MKCEKCGTEYPSKYYFKGEGKLNRLICNACYDSYSQEDITSFLSEPKSEAKVIKSRLKQEKLEQIYPKPKSFLGWYFETARWQNPGSGWGIIGSVAIVKSMLALLAGLGVYPKVLTLLIIFFVGGVAMIKYGYTKYLNVFKLGIKQLRDHHNIESIKLVLNSKIMQIRKAAVDLLGLIGDVHCVMPLMITQIEDEDNDIKEEATLALNTINNKTIVPAVI